MSTHLIADPTATPATTADPTWLALSVAMTDEVPVIADRDDLLVTIAPGAGRGAPACFLPALATIEVNGHHLGAVDPATVTPHRIGDRARYGPAWGLLVHECAHARHSVWEAPPDAPAGAVAAATLLEESRIEAAQIRRRPDDRRWLRASASHLILADSGVNDPARAPGTTPTDAAHAAALLIARADAGILTADEVEPVTRTVTEVLGEATLATLRAIWTAAHTTADDDVDTMIELGLRWCDAVGTDAADHPSDPASGGDPTGGGTVRMPSPMTGAISDALRRIDRAVSHEPTPPDPPPPQATRPGWTRPSGQPARPPPSSSAPEPPPVGRRPRQGARRRRAGRASSRAPARPPAPSAAPRGRSGGR